MDIKQCKDLRKDKLIYLIPIIVTQLHFPLEYMSQSEKKIYEILWFKLLINLVKLIWKNI